MLSAMLYKVIKRKLDYKCFFVRIFKNLDKIAQQYIHSLRTLEELEQVKNLLPKWSETLEWHFKYVQKRIEWVHGNATNQILEFLTKQKL